MPLPQSLLLMPQQGIGDVVGSPQSVPSPRSLRDESGPSQAPPLERFQTLGKHVWDLKMRAE